MSTPTRADVIVLGAGWFGLAAAKTYLRVKPQTNLLILDADTTVGGVWSASRIYPGLIADSPNGLYEFSDFSMLDDGHEEYAQLPATRVHEYLARYAERFGLLDRIRFGVRIIRAQRGADVEGNGTAARWVLTAETGDVYTCAKLVMATGLASRPSVPNIPNNGFSGPVLHTKDLGASSSLLTAPTVKTITVLGGSKSAFEACALGLAAGKNVQWVIRETGGGVGNIIRLPDRKTLARLGSVASVRAVNMLMPSVWNTDGWWYWFLHSGKSRVGSWLWWRMCRSGSRRLQQGPEYEKSENGEKIRPLGDDASVCFPTTTAILFQHDNTFLNTLHEQEKIHVHRASITSLSADGAVLSTGQTLPCDAVIYATGWEHVPDIFSPSDAVALGVPVPLSEQPPAVAEHWQKLDASAEIAIKKAFPHIADPPVPRDRLPTHTPWRLYRLMAPASSATAPAHERDIVFTGVCSTTMTATMAELQALWAVAWMEGLLPALPTGATQEADVERAIALQNAWMGRRYLHSVERLRPQCSAEVQTYFDALVRDLGLRVERRRKGLFGGLREWLGQYRSWDYRGLVDELMMMQNQGRKDKF